MRIYSLSALFVLTCGLMLGQDKTAAIYPYIPNYDQLKTYLNLTDAQLQSLNQIQESKAQAEGVIQNQLRDKYLALNTEMALATPNPTTVGQLSIDIRNLGKQLPLSGAPWRPGALTVLNDDQKSKLPALVTAMKLNTPAYQAATLNLIDDPNAGVAYPLYIAATSGVAGPASPVGAAKTTSR